MSYQVIARKWRPQNFDQLIGQKHISQTLTNALKNGRLPHALLFTGPRGTGKTSSARILAKALRCPNAVDFKPCNVCDSCIDIAQSRSVDVIEIDGASNNGVDAIRELRDTVGYMPSSGKYKVYIIDEVHMLSTSAFNALLKTLEEPPPHVIFIMATTEVHKIPQTILSRCQRFDFRTISTRQITEHLKNICAKDGVEADEEALWIIARQGEGSMRDSQSLLDQMITFANGKLTRESVIQTLGLTDRALLLETLTAIAQRDTRSVFSILEKIVASGSEPSLFAKDLLENIRNLLLVKISVEGSTTILELPDSEIRYLQTLSAEMSEEEIHLLFDMALKGAADIPKSSDPRIVLEMVLLRMAQAPKLASLQALLSGAVIPTTVSGVDGSGGSRLGTAAISRPASTPATNAKAPTAAPATTHQTQVPRKMDAMGLNPQDRWLEFVQKIRSADALFAAKVESLLFFGEKDKVLQLAVPPKFAFLKDQLAESSVRSKLQSFIESHFGPEYTHQVQLSKEEAPTGATSAKEIVEKKEKAKEEEMAKKVAEHPLIKSATTAFKGQIKSIKSQQT